MIPRLNRLPSNRLTNAIDSYSPHLIVKAISNTLMYHRFAFVVGKRVSKSAVKRNRMKRLLREIMLETTLSYKKSMDIVTIARKDITDVPRQELQNEIKSILVQCANRL